MELNDLKSGWKNAGGASRTEADLQKMTRIIHHPSLKKIRTKLVIETIGLVLFLLVYYDWFDGHKKSLGVNALLVSSVALYILNDVIGYIALAKPISGNNLKRSLTNFLARIKRLSLFSLTISFLYGTALLVFFSSVISFTKEKNMLLAGLVAIFLISTFLSFKLWKSWINKLKQQVRDFELDE